MINDNTYNQMHSSLHEVIERLTQIVAITMNQSTLLLQQEVDMDMVEQMAAIKEEIMNEVDQSERQFEQYYLQEKENLTDKEQVKPIQDKIAEVFKLKEKVIKEEQNNMLLIQEKAKRDVEQVKINKSAAKVAQLYGGSIKK